MTFIDFVYYLHYRSIYNYYNKWPIYKHRPKKGTCCLNVTFKKNEMRHNPINVVTGILRSQHFVMMLLFNVVKIEGDESVKILNSIKWSNFFLYISTYVHTCIYIESIYVSVYIFMLRNKTRNGIIITYIFVRMLLL